MKRIILSSLVLVIMLATASIVVAGKNQTKIKNGEIAGQCTTIQDGTLLASDGSVITTGFDKWGYNYQGRLFNGMYCDSYRDADWCQEYKDVELQMKWNDAWLSNKDCDGNGSLDRHYGYSSYIGSGAWLTNHQSGSYLSNWDITGEWVLEFDYLGSLYIHDMTIVDNTFTGTGGYPSEGPYTITWIVTGTINGDDIEMTIDYDSSSYYVDAVGTIAQDGTMSGTWSNPSQSGEWESTEGVATGEICKWNYFVKIVAAPSDAYTEDGVWYAADGTEIGPEIWGAFAIIQQVENDHCAGLNGMQYVSPAGAGLGQYKEKVTFIHYADGRHEQIGGPELIKKVKPVKDDGCYSFIRKDMEWKTQPDYIISVEEGEEGITEDQFVAAVNASISEWNDPEFKEDTSFIEFGEQTINSEYPTGLNGDNVNVISFGDYADGNVIAVCSVWGIFRGPPSDREIIEFDVMLDTDWTWGDASQDSSVMDLQNILTHELGHAVGLGDLYNPKCSTQTMYGYSTEGDIEKRTLESGDIAGLNILYGN